MTSFRARVKDRLRTASGAAQAQAEIETLRATVAAQRVRIGDLEREVARVSPQVAALEVRLENLRENVERGPAPTVEGPEPSSMGSRKPEPLWDELQRQQEQVRARLAAATRFEERLRKLEEERAHR